MLAEASSITRGALTGAGELARSIDGCVFDPATDVWRIDAPSCRATYRFDNLLGVTPDLISVLKALFCMFLVTRNAGTVRLRFSVMREFLARTALRKAAISVVEAADLLNYVASKDRRRAHRITVLKVTLSDWSKAGFGCLAEDAAALLTQLPSPTNITGEAVRTSDPDKGPLTDIEFAALMTALHRHYADGKLDRERYTLGLLAASLGARPIQLALLKTRDLEIREQSDSSMSYVLHVPRAKQKDTMARSLMRERPLTRDIGELVAAQADAVREGLRLEDFRSGEAPLFPCPRRGGVLAGFVGHSLPKDLGDRIARLFEGLGVPSERTGRALKISQIRLRRTMGTRAAAEGHGPLVIAELLDHTTTMQAHVYVEVIPEIVERIDRAVALQLAPLAHAFAGTLVRREDQHGLEVGSHHLIHDMTLAPDSEVGACGRREVCGLLAPLACYTCRHFRPWLDGPHEQVLRSLIADRDRLWATTDARIASVNDPTILAVADVINRCAAATSGKNA